ncbi:MAG: hypothetical protein HWE25_03670 [Alphaproteobacteria bacterium]|nr:hypothetical protein [Alphaproteobacteria bacterium]
MRILLSLFWLLLCLSPVSAETFRAPAPDRNLNHSDYEIKLLRIALEHAGDHELVLVEDYRGLPSNQGRKLRQFVDGNSPYDVIFSGYSPARENELRMIYIPLTRGLLGHRLLFIRRATDTQLKAIHSLAGLTKAITLGMPISHPERSIYEAANFTVVAAPGGEALWDLLARGRYDALLFGADESALILEKYGGIRDGASLVISNHIRVSYAYDSFFYVAKGDDRRAAIIEEGLKKAYASGAFMTHFQNFPPIREGLALIEAGTRQEIHMDNPFISDRFRAIPAKYWHQFGSETE